LHASARADALHGKVKLIFANTGKAAAVFHVYDKLNLDRLPRRYMVEPNERLDDDWAAMTDNAGRYDLWVLGPNGFHRHATGRVDAHPGDPEVSVAYRGDDLDIVLHNRGAAPCTFVVTANAYFPGDRETVKVQPGRAHELRRRLRHSGRWYDFSIEVAGAAGFLRRFAGRIENGRDSLSDPALGGLARGDQP
jgi:phospholipase C